MTGWDDNDVHTRPTTTTSYKGSHITFFDILYNSRITSLFIGSTFTKVIYMRTVRFARVQGSTPTRQSHRTPPSSQRSSVGAQQWARSVGAQSTWIRLPPPGSRVRAAEVVSVSRHAAAGAKPAGVGGQARCAGGGVCTTEVISVSRQAADTEAGAQAGCKQG
eukprot:949666-Prorocentrum_minimum.AAC.2